MAKNQDKFSNKKSFSNTIHQRVLKVTQDITESFDKLEINDEEGEKFFFHEISLYYRDLVNIVYHLRKILINIGRNNQTASDLQEIVENLNKLACSTETSLNLPPNELKTKVKNDMVEIGAQVERLMKIVEYDDLHELKQQVLDCQHDLVLCIEKLKLNNKCRYLSVADFEALLHEVIDKIINNVILVRSGHEFLEEDFSHYVCHGIQILQDGLHHMQQNRNRDKHLGEFWEAFKNTEDAIMRIIKDIMEAVISHNPMKKMLAVLDDCHTNTKLAAIVLQLVMKDNNLGKKEAERCKYLVSYHFINALTCGNCINQGIEDAVIGIGRERKIRNKLIAD